MNKPILAWYFSTQKKRLRYNDGRKIAPGVTHEVEGVPKVCRWGLHGSAHIADALKIAPGPIVWRVELSGDMDKELDKVAATTRHYLWGYDASKIIQDFARKCALDVAHLWTDSEVVIHFLKTGDKNENPIGIGSEMDINLGGYKGNAINSAHYCIIHLPLPIPYVAYRVMDYSILAELGHRHEKSGMLFDCDDFFTAAGSRAYKEAKDEYNSILERMIIENRERS